MVFLLLSFFNSVSSALGQGQFTITGETDGCPSDIETYTVTPTTGVVTFNWQVTSPAGTIINYVTAGCEVLWNLTGAALVEVTMFDAANQNLGSASLNITVHPVPSPVLTTSFNSECVVIRELGPQIQPSSCWNVCEEGNVDYFVNPYDPASFFNWSASGEQNSTVNGNTFNVNWAGAGSGMISVTETNQYGCATSVSQCININESPEAIIRIDELNADCRNTSSVSICDGQTVFFSGDAITGATNSPIIAWSWDFGDGTYSSLQNPNHNWSSGGSGMSYIVTLTVTNACNCTGTCSLYVNVDPLTGVNIECAGPVCANSTVTYYTDALCDPFDWQVTGGTISSITPTPFTNQVTVQWGNGTNGPGMLCLNNSNGQNCPNYCPSNLCIEIPIISSTSAISGPSVVCAGEQYSYSVPEMTGSIYNWIVTGGTINHGLYTNEILVTWHTNITSGTVEVNYFNGMLGCGGQGNLSVTIASPFSISGPDHGCPGETITFTPDNPLGVTLDWTATDDITTSYYLGSSTGPITVNWTYGPGAFQIIATPTGGGGYCNGNATMPLTIHELPPAPAPFTGERLVCLGSAHVYAATAASSAYQYQWQVSGGTPPAATGTQVSVLWSMTPTFTLSLTQTQLSTGCASLPYSETITPRLYSPPTFNLPLDACVNTVVGYSINNVFPAGAYHFDALEWKISPAGAGSVVGGQGTPNAQIQWNNTVMTNVMIYINTRLCGTDISSDIGPNASFIFVNLVGQSSVQITPTDPAPAPANTLTLCEGITQVFSVSGNWATTWWDYGDNSNDHDDDHDWTLSGMGAGPYSFPVNVIATDANGCEATGSIMVNVLPGPYFAVQYAPPCLSTTNPTVTLTAITPMSGTYTYAWNTGASTPSITVTSVGIYTATVAGSNGCSSSIPVTIDNCNPPGPPSCPPNPSLTININVNQVVPAPCGTYEFAATIFNPLGASITNITWRFGDGTGASGTPATHTYPVAADYSVELLVESTDGTNSYCNYRYETVTVPVIANFISTLLCPLPSSPDEYQVQFTDQSTYNPSSAGFTWVWDFSNGLPFGSFSVPNVQNPLVSMPPLSPATQPYDVLFTVYETATGNSVCEITHQIVVPTPPQVQIEVTDPVSPPPPGPFCEKQSVVQFTANNVNLNLALVNHAYWDFDDGSSYIPINPIGGINVDKVYDDYDNYDVTLTVTDLYGCSYNDVTNINIYQNQLDGTVGPVAPGVSFCPGGSGLIEYTNSGFDNPTSYLWSNGATTIIPNIMVNSTGNYAVTVYNSATGCRNPIPDFGIATTHNLPTLHLLGDLSLCEGEALSLDGQSGITGSGYTFDWTVTDPMGITTSYSGPQLSVSNTFSGVYQVTLTLTTPTPVCQVTATTVVEVFPAPAPPVITVTPVPPCEDQAVLLEVNPGGNQVNWSTGQSNAIIQVVSSGVYQATLTNAAGCSASSTAEVFDNPYLGWFTPGCFEYCDTSVIIIPGSAPIQFDKWTWFIDGVANGSGTGIVPDLTLPALAPGIHIISIELQMNYTGNPTPICTIHSEDLEITIKRCPCPANPKVNIYCMSPQPDDDTEPHYYHFELTTNLQLPCTNSALVQLSSPDGGISLLGGTVQPQFLEGILLTGLSYPSYACFDLDITDINEPQCNCLTRVCQKLPNCQHPLPCEHDLLLTNVVCTGTSQGSPVYSFDLTVNFGASTTYPKYLMFYQGSQGIMSGLNATIIQSAGTYTFTGQFIDTDPTDGFCIEISVYDFTTHGICSKSVCEPYPPVNCRVMEITRNEANGDDNPFLTLMPNPASENITIRYRNAADVGMISISAINGTLKGAWNLTDREGTLNVETHQWPGGIYTCVLADKSGLRLIKKLVVLKP